jgi:acyl-CoA synthetase (AMP-forming)/AMP-acid ligase II/aryl carrier-like protein
VVDAADGRKLAPVGCIGELWIEGPLVGQGYIGDPDKTAAAFVEDPEWLLRGGPGYVGRSGRLYRTGDLVRYRSDGSLEFIGRKDSQVKIRGQRVELGEVEHNVQLALRPAHGALSSTQVAADVVTLKGSEHPVLIAFVVQSAWASHTEGELYTALSTIVDGIDERLADAVPSYMIPTGYVPLPVFPTTATGKTDRRQLRRLGEALSAAQVDRVTRTVQQHRTPSTAMEQRLQRLWATVLKLDASIIGAGDNFLRIGGDSILAMRLVAAARHDGLKLTVLTVLRHPVLEDQARVLVPSKPVNGI